MSDTNPILRRLPLIIILTVAVLGAFFLRDYLTFQALADNREALIAFRDNNYLLTVLVFIADLCSDGCRVQLTRCHDHDVGRWVSCSPHSPGPLFNVSCAQRMGATGDLSLPRAGVLAKQLGARLEGSEGIVKKIKDGIDENQWSMLFLIRLVPAVPFFLWPT